MQKCIPCCRDQETSGTQWWYRITSSACCLLGMEKEDLGLRPNCHLLGLGMTTPHRSCVISENGQSPPCLGIGSGSSDLKRRLLAARKQSVREQGIYESESGNTGCGGAHLATTCSLAAYGWRAWSEEVTAGSAGLRGVGAAVKVNKLLSWLQASPQTSTRKEVCSQRFSRSWRYC